jgi:hypothetical protein
LSVVGKLRGIEFPLDRHFFEVFRGFLGILEKPLVRANFDERKRLPARCRPIGSATLVCAQEFVALDLSLRADGS